ncbi:MAG: hypothetical protein ACK5TC_03145, partial [bacterium]
SSCDREIRHRAERIFGKSKKLVPVLELGSPVVQSFLKTRGIPFFPATANRGRFSVESRRTPRRCVLQFKFLSNGI